MHTFVVFKIYYANVSYENNYHLVRYNFIIHRAVLFCFKINEKHDKTNVILYHKWLLNVKPWNENDILKCFTCETWTVSIPLIFGVNNLVRYTLYPILVYPIYNLVVVISIKERMLDFLALLIYNILNRIPFALLVC